MKLKAKIIVGVLSLATLGTLSYFTENKKVFVKLCYNQKNQADKMRAR